MPTRVTGMYSGLDTESLISELVKAKSKGVEKLKKNKTKAEWKSEAWTDLNKKIKSLKSTISGLQFSTDYLKKTTKVSNSSAVSVITGAGAMNSVQSLSITHLAKTGYLTGAQIESQTKGEKITGSTKVSELSGFAGSGGSFSITTGGKTTNIEIDTETTINQLIDKLKGAGVNANFDATNQRLFIGASASGTENDFAITANDNGGLNAMNALGINAEIKKDPNDANYKHYQELIKLAPEVSKALQADGSVSLQADSDLYKYLSNQGIDMEDPSAVKDAYTNLARQIVMADQVLNNNPGASKDAIRLYGEDAEIELNGAKFKSSSNNIEVNGLTFTCLAVASDITVTTQDDTDGIYDMLKSYIKQYNEVINEMDKLYNAASNSKYEPLTDEEKDALSEKEIEKLEEKAKEGLLRRDSTLGTLFNAMKDVMASGFDIGGKTMYLADFGISTMNYFEAAEFERSAYHIDGDSDDDKTSGNEDKLKSMIATDSKTVISFFTKLANKLSEEMGELSKSSDDQSYGSFYEDKKMKKELSDWDKKIAEAEARLTAYEDKWYSKFSKMETALSKMESKNSYLSGLFTGK